LRIRPRRLALELLYSVSIYYIFFLALLLSDVLFLGGALRLVRITVPGPYREVWITAFALFLSEVMLSLSPEDEDGARSLLLAGLSYFTYCQLWLPVVLKGFYDDFVRRKARVWAKTERFQVTRESAG